MMIDQTVTNFLIYVYKIILNISGRILFLSHDLTCLK